MQTSFPLLPLSPSIPQCSFTTCWCFPASWVQSTSFILTSFQLYFQPNPLSRVNPSIDSYLGTFQLLRPNIIISAMGKASIQTSKQDRLFKKKKKAASFSHSYGSGQCHLSSLVTLLHFPSSTASTKSTTGLSDLQGTFKITYPSSMEQLKRSRAQTFLAACLSSLTLRMKSIHLPRPV